MIPIERATKVASQFNRSTENETFQVWEMKGQRGRTCLLHTCLFESHLHQKDIDEVLHVRPFVKVWYNEDDGVILEDPPHIPRVSPTAMFSIPRGGEILHRMISDQSKSFH